MISDFFSLFKLFEELSGLGGRFLKNFSPKILFEFYGLIGTIGGKINILKKKFAMFSFLVDRIYK